MFISIQELELRRLDFAETFAPGAIDLGPELTQLAPLATSGHAELLEENHGGKVKVQDIRLIGKFGTRVEQRCARCLEPVTSELENEFDLLYRPAKAVEAGDEIAISDADAEIGFYTGEGLLLEDALKEQVLLALPLKVVCQEDCKGLCPHCGANRNTVSCDCKQEVSDPRWAALAGIKEKLKSPSSSEG